MPEAAAEIDRLGGLLASAAPWVRHYGAYYEGRQPIRFMAPAMIKQFGDRITALVINWPRLGTDAYENRLDIEGFRYSGDSSRDDELQDMWQASNCDGKSQMAHLESLITGRSYVCVGAGDATDDPPLITVEHPLQMFADLDPRTDAVRSALKRWDDVDGSRWAVLYLPDSTGVYRYGPDGWELDSPVDEHGLGKVPVVPLVNRPRLLQSQYGVSEFHDVLPLADAANKQATDMMISGEFHAMPRRWAFGLKEEDFVDASGNQISPWSMMAGHLWANENPDIKVGQFPEADLAVFHNTIRVLAQLASQVLALPPHYMSFTTDNPSSADAIRSSETQLVKRVERKHTFLGESWEEAMRLALRIQTGTWDKKARSLETMWRDPSTPTIAQKADATLKLVTAGIIPIEQAREDLGYTPEQRRRMADMDDLAAVDQNVATIARTFQAGATPAVTPPVTGAPAAGN